MKQYFRYSAHFIFKSIIVPGIMGVLQAMEAIKILTDQVGVLSGKMLIFDGLSTTFYNVTLRSPNSKCIACNDRPLSNFTDYEEFCGTMSHDKVLTYSN